MPRLALTTISDYFGVSAAVANADMYAIPTDEGWIESARKP